MIEYVLGFRFDKNKENVVLIEKLKPDWQKGKLNGVGGKIEISDQQHLNFGQVAIAREFDEEAGLSTKPEDWKEVGSLNGPDCIVHIFMSIGDISECHTMESEEIYICSVAEIPTNIVPNLRWLIPIMLDDTIVKPLVFNFTV